MPIAIVAVVLVVAAAVGFTVLRDDPGAETTSEAVVEARPVNEETEADSAASSQPVPESEELADNPDAFTSGMVEPTPEPQDTPVATRNRFRNGAYTTEASYFTPARTRHDMDITLTVADGVVTDASITYDGGAPETGHHRRFDSAYRDAVIGVPLDEVSLARVGGASLTSEAFNEAVDTIQQQAS
jgi:hypothetical protein